VPGEIEIEILGAREILRAFRELPAEASDQLREESGQIARKLADDIEAAARAEGRQAALMAATVKVRRDRVPVVQAGGAKRVGRNRVPAADLLYASEFGSNLRQFRPHLKGDSYWFYDTVERQDSAILAQWLEAVDAILNAFERAV